MYDSVYVEYDEEGPEDMEKDTGKKNKNCVSNEVSSHFKLLAIINCLKSNYSE